MNIPVGVGVFVGSWIAGYVYGTYGEKAVLALKYLATRAPGHGSIRWNGSVDTLERAVGVTRSEAFARLMEKTDLDAAAGDAAAVGHLPARSTRSGCPSRRSGSRRWWHWPSSAGWRAAGRT